MSELPDLRRQLQEAGRYLLENDLTWGNAGNLSARLDDDAAGRGRCLITASGTSLGELADDDLVECYIDPPAAVSGTRKPSKELPMHAAIYRRRPEIKAVLHTSSFYTTLVACSDLELPGNWFVEDMYYVERVARVPYVHPGAPGLGDAVAAVANQANILLLENHGGLVYDVSVREALMALHTLEVVCRMAVTATGAGINMRGLPPETVADFLERSGYRPRRRWEGRL